MQNDLGHLPRMTCITNGATLCTVNPTTKTACRSTPPNTLGQCGTSRQPINNLLMRSASLTSRQATTLPKKQSVEHKRRVPNVQHATHACTWSPYSACTCSARCRIKITLLTSLFAPMFSLRVHRHHKLVSVRLNAQQLTIYLYVFSTVAS